MATPLRSELIKRVPIILAITNKLAEEVSTKLETAFPSDGCAFFYEKDDPSVEDEEGKKSVVITYPFVTMYDPDTIPFPLMQSQTNVFRDVNEDELTAKEFPPPIAVKLRYAFRTTCENPDNVARLQMFFLRLSNTLLTIYPNLDVDGDFVQNVPLEWHKPQRFRFDQNLTTHIYTVDAWTNIEHMEFESRNLINPTAPLGLTTTLMTLETRRGVKATLAQSVAPGDTVVYVVGHTRDFPMTGTIVFSRNEENFTYTSRRPDHFIGTEPIESHHFSGETLTYLVE